jgi:hypothetical protein
MMTSPSQGEPSVNTASPRPSLRQAQRRARLRSSPAVSDAKYGTRWSVSTALGKPPGASGAPRVGARVARSDLITRRPLRMPGSSWTAAAQRLMCPAIAAPAGTPRSNVGDRSPWARHRTRRPLPRRAPHRPAGFARDPELACSSSPWKPHHVGQPGGEPTRQVPGPAAHIERTPRRCEWSQQTLEQRVLGPVGAPTPDPAATGRSRDLSADLSADVHATTPLRCPRRGGRPAGARRRGGWLLPGLDRVEDVPQGKRADDDQVRRPCPRRLDDPARSMAHC